MDAVSPQRTDKPAGKQNAPAGGDGNPQQGAPSGQNWRWLWGVLAIGIVAILLAVGTIKTNNAKSVTYTKFLQDVSAKQVESANISNSTGEIGHVPVRDRPRGAGWRARWARSRPAGLRNRSSARRYRCPQRPHLQGPLRQSDRGGHHRPGSVAPSMAGVSPQRTEKPA